MTHIERLLESATLQALPFKILIVHLRACWTNTLPGDAGRAGENIRLDQETAAYRSMEAASNYEGCFNMIWLPCADMLFLRREQDDEHRPCGRN